MKRKKNPKFPPDFHQTLEGIREHKRREKAFNEAVGTNPTMTPEQFYLIRLSQIWCRPVLVALIGFVLVCLRGCSI